MSNGHKVYSVTLHTIWENIKGSWGFDGDDFQVNQLQHPYQGSVYQGFARSAGLGFWESSIYTFLGSYVWEIAGMRPLPITPEVTRRLEPGASPTTSSATPGSEEWRRAEIEAR